MSTARSIAQGLTSAAFFAAGGMKLAGGMKGEFERFGYPQWFRVAVASGEVAAAAGLAGAVYTHLVRAGDGPAPATPPLVLGGLSAWIAASGR